MDESDFRKEIDRMIFEMDKALLKKVDPSGYTLALAECLHEFGIPATDIPRFVLVFCEKIKALEEEPKVDMKLLDSEIRRAMKREMGEE